MNEAGRNADHSQLTIHCSPFTIYLGLQAALGQPLDKLALEQQEENDHGQDHDHRGGVDQAPVAAVAAKKVKETGGDGL